jgi:DNA-binding IclR family transcriptional regulator
MGVITVALLSVIRHWHLREGMPIREIARRSGLSRNTIRKYLASNVVEPRYVRRTNANKLDAYAEKLAGWLKTEANKGRKQRRNIKQLHADLVQLCYRPPAPAAISPKPPVLESAVEMQ